MNGKPIVVVALGGNAISREDQQGNVAEQFENSRATAVALADLVENGYSLVVTHGNGPQIGNFLLRNEAAAGAIYPLPMEVAVAHVQGGMGFMISQALTNELRRRGFERSVTAVVTTIRVDADDPSFRDPTKPIGKVLSKADAEEFRRGEGWAVKEISPGRFRRVVASPIPRHIMEIKMIRRAVQEGELLVVCGGGGIPVVEDPGDGLRGVKAVIDKDHASALLATELQANLMMILTAVDYVSIDFGKPNERQIRQMTVAEAERWMGEGQFPAGSMGPKVQAAISFLRTTRAGNAEVIIGPLHRAADAIAGRIGTRITG